MEAVPSCPTLFAHDEKLGRIVAAGLRAAIHGGTTRRTAVYAVYAASRVA